ncbi:MAG: hypothetical protein Q4A37_01730 [Candidatus Saccharibacteria bacterium]|nr:hypothetical protein [Candidatus Saccharibacteria bacterium]
MRKSGGFVLPTVVVASVVLLLVLLAALQLASSSAAALRDQYYNMLAREAAEAGAAFMGECMKQRHFDTTKVVRPGNDCLGGGSASVVHKSGNLQTTFEGRYVMVGQNQAATIIGKSELRRTDGRLYKEYRYTARQHSSYEEDRSSTRASHRWWYVGQKTRIDFGPDNSHTPRAERIPNGHRIDEGITTISNRKGEVLFYTNGKTLWNRDNNVLQNSHDLKGSTTATQAVAAFPIDKEERYYVVISNSANDSRKEYRNGQWIDVYLTPSGQGFLYYSVVDMQGDHGRGSVLPNAKNIHMAGTWEYSSEALNAVPMHNGNGYWVYTYTPTPTNNIIWGFRFTEKSKANLTEYRRNPAQHGEAGSVIVAYDVTKSDFDLRARICEGNPPAIRTNVNNKASTATAFGTINFNSDYSKMAVMMGGGGCKWNYTYSNYGTVHVLDINRDTGYLTKYTSFYAGPVSRGKNTEKELYVGYSADFSPSGQYIYTSTIYPARVRRFDISNPDRSAVQRSERFIGSSGCSDYTGPYQRGTECRITSYTLQDGVGEGGGQILRGPNGKMYVADNRAPWLSVINNPDAPTPAGTHQGSTIATTVGWQYGKYGGIRFPSHPDPSPRNINNPALYENHALSFYGLPQMVTLYSPRLVQY